ncbi:hypothetical protein C8R45DRAFT_937375 [Mycena sanguinolenta]|nr:hypothetical protein C8R45DRAFT_937375 [Mycena sanguinolenta]
MAAHHGRPSKRAKKYISGLKNQSRQPSSPESPAESLGDYFDTQIPDTVELDSITYLEVDTDHDDSDNEADWDEIAENEFNNCLLEMVAQMEDDRLDAEVNDWIPTKEVYEATHPKEYMKGPDTGPFSWSDHPTDMISIGSFSFQWQFKSTTNCHKSSVSRSNSGEAEGFGGLNGMRLEE